MEKFRAVSRKTPAKELAAKQAVAAIQNLSLEHQKVLEAVATGDGVTLQGNASVQKIAQATKLPQPRVELLLAEIRCLAERIMIR